ncbi:MAG: hypothetical protein J6T54_12470 [Fibrobacter sp.]|nr:hypothetical protein [Fibrobacter sp.]
MAKSNSGGKQRNANSLANLKVIHDSERASMLGKIGAEAKRIKQERKALLHDDISEIVLKQMNTPESLYRQLKEFGINIGKTERIDRIIFYRSLLKAIKDGNSEQLLRIADFAGLKSIPMISDEDYEEQKPVEVIIKRFGTNGD